MELTANVTPAVARRHPSLFTIDYILSSAGEQSAPSGGRSMVEYREKLNDFNAHLVALGSQSMSNQLLYVSDRKQYTQQHSRRCIFPSYGGYNLSNSEANNTSSMLAEHPPRLADSTGGGCDDCEGRKKKIRTVFSQSQVRILETMFTAKRYLTSIDRSHLAQTLRLSEPQVKIWFQNRRNKSKKVSRARKQDRQQFNTDSDEKYCRFPA